MNNKSNYKFLLSELSSLKGVGKQTANLLKKKELITFLIYYGSSQSHIPTEVYHQK